jgi:plasmid stabilization system protein ParE
MSRVVLLEEAVVDLEAGRRFYERQEPGIGNYFIRSLSVDLEALELEHGIHARHFGLHRQLARRFPYGIYYRETADQTQVVAILDLRRDPERNRLALLQRVS